jgi:ATP-binding cassette subfamily B protein IrtA
MKCKGGILLKKQSNLSRLLTIAGSYRYLTYASWILSAISALIALVPYYFIWQVMREVLEVAPDFSRAQNLTYNGWMAVMFAVIAVLVYIAGLMCSHLGAFRIATNLRLQSMNHIVKLPLGFAEHFGSGKLRKIVNESSAATETYLAHQLPDRANALATPCGLLVLLFVFDWRLGLLSLAPVLLGFLIMMAMTGKEMQQKMKEYQNALDDMSNEAVEYVRGIPVVKTFGQTIFSFKKFKDSIDRYKVWVIAYTKQLRTPMMFYTAAINGVFVFLIAGALLFTQDQVTTEFLLNLVFYIIITPIISVTLTRIMFQSENAMIVDDALQRIDSVLNLEPLKETAHPMHPKDGSVELEQVHFSYNGEKDVLNGISISISAGQTVAFVGPSGGGKTTLANLISRFFDPQSGTVRVGGVDVRDIPKEELMNTVSFVFQNSRLIKASIFENVRLGKPEATREEVMAALKNAQCDDILEKLPDGMDTVIGTKGVYLSGGEQQRIAIARVMLKNTPIIILDEATAFADPDNETRVQAAFSKLSQGKTVIMIAHRLSTVAGADRIYVVKDGQIAESGSSRELMERGGLFARMWQNYQTSIQWKVQKEVQ